MSRHVGRMRFDDNDDRRTIEVRVCWRERQREGSREGTAVSIRMSDRCEINRCQRLRAGGQAGGCTSSVDVKEIQHFIIFVFCVIAASLALIML